MKSSRRRFLEASLGVPLAGRLSKLGGGLFGEKYPRHENDAVVTPGQMQFENPQVIRYDANCFTVKDQDIFIHSGAFHYPRCPKPLWRDRLMKFKHAGFNTIETYVFWNYHEPEEGKANLTEFEDFVKLVHELGFYMIVRPGPYVCAEWERGGFPHWVAAKRFPLRGNNPQSLETSKHWFDLVLPVILRQQIMFGGPIIMVQVENEYDFSPPMPDADKREYVRFLAQQAWNSGILVPVMTCWTKQARENSDPAMARIMDTCNFYPRWNVVKEVLPALEKLRKEEPFSPVGVTELQGGWFSEFGGKLSVDQDGVNGAQLNLLTKTVIEQGATYYSYYMGFGGTNFDWAAKNLTTTYDYAAPIREPGGLWEKYYAARGICQTLRLVGEVLARAQKVLTGVESTNANVSVTERAFVKSGVVFVRENANAEQRFKMSFPDPNSPTHRTISIPREGELVLGAREMKMLPLQVRISGGQLRYTTAEVLAHGQNLERSFLILYDEPGRVVEIALATEEEPKIEGDTLYRYWDSDYESVVFGVRVEPAPSMLLFKDSLQIILLPRKLALHTWTAEFPPTVILGSEGTRPISVPLITDAYLPAGSGSHRQRLWFEVDFLPGSHDFTCLLPPLPAKCRVDGAPTEFHYNRPWRTASFEITTPPLPYQPIDVSEGSAWVEKFDPATGQWMSPPNPSGAALPALEDFGPVPYAYVKYRAQFNFNGQARAFIETFGEDQKKIFLNGQLVKEASNAKPKVEFELSKYARAGMNLLEIAYEQFGAPNFGPKVGELKGISSVRIGSDAANSTPVENWQIQRYPALMRGREVDAQSTAAAWNRASFRCSGAEEPAPAFTWCRAEFPRTAPVEGRNAPWKLVFDADCDALLYWNGKFLGRYATIGPQKEFYVPETYDASSGKNNVLTFVLAYTARAEHVRTLRLAPYAEFSTRRTHIEFEY